MGDGLHLVEDLIEKPAPGEASSNLAIASRYVLSPRIFSYIERTKRGKGDEVQLTDALKLMLKDLAIYGVELMGHRHDMGNKLDFLKTNILYGFERAELSYTLLELIKSYPT